jgi:arginyl-tRNA synthetase
MILITLLQATIHQLYPDIATPELRISRPTHAQFGDYSSNIALMLAKTLGKSPRDIATAIRAALMAQTPSAVSLIEKIDIAGPGHLNFFMQPTFYQQIISAIQQQQADYGRQNIGQGARWHLEYVSANPTGPLHVGHGRGAAYGATVATLLKHMGYDVTQEYYVNDAGRQMNILTLSTWLRYLQLLGLNPLFPDNVYQGDYIIDIAKKLHAESAENPPTAFDLNTNPFDHTQFRDADDLLDAYIAYCQSALGTSGFQRFKSAALNSILDDIRLDLAEFGITFNQWFSEQSLLDDNSTDGGALSQAIDALEKSGHTYTQDNALWFRSTTFGDDKDRVLVRDNGQPTYFASDVAYHLNKIHRGYQRLINIWGSDHHGYIPRLKAAIQALDYDPAMLQVELVQFANLFQDGERLSMSTRSGEFVTLRALRDDVGRDAARFYYVMRRCDQHMDFDLSLAKSQSKDNPVYYIQYAHARLCSVLTRTAAPAFADLALLTAADERSLLNHLSEYNDVVMRAALQFEPHVLVQFLHALASDFHSYYNATKILVDDPDVRDARLVLAAALQQILNNGLTLLGVSAPAQM